MIVAIYSEPCEEMAVWSSKNKMTELRAHFSWDIKPRPRKNVWSGMLIPHSVNERQELSRLPSFFTVRSAFREQPLAVHWDIFTRYI
jgi:hypothetical protein